MRLQAIRQTGRCAIGWLALVASACGLAGKESATPQLPPVANAVEAQPLAANVQRVIEALTHLGASLPAPLVADLERAGQARDAKTLQEVLDRHVLLTVHVNPESRVRVLRGVAQASLQQAGYTPVLVKVLNEGRVTARLRIGSPQAGPVYAGMAELSAQRMQQEHLRENENLARRTDRFLDVEMFGAAPMTANLSGLEVEYAIALIYSSEAGRRDIGDTVVKREPLAPDPLYRRGLRLIEVIVNGRVVASREVAADGELHPVQFSVRIERSSWVALRQFPQLHTNPVNVLVAGRPIRASRESALWAIACIDQLWRARSQRIAPAERGAAEKAYEEARAFYRRAANEATSASLVDPNIR